MNYFKHLYCSIACIFILNAAFCVNILPNFGANIRMGCNPLYIHFTDSSTIDIGSITGWLWNFGDGYTSTLQHPAHAYQIPGSYDVSLTVIGSSGDTARITKTAYIYSAIVPKANFIPKPSITTLDKPSIEFVNRTQNETVNTHYNWNFGDREQYNPEGGTSKIKSPIYKYSDTGHYEVMLVASNEYGCNDTTIRQVTILPPEPNLITFFTYPYDDGKLGFIGGKGYNCYPLLVYGNIYSLEVYDLFGRRVFYSNKDYGCWYLNAWTGSYLANGKFTPNGFYIVRLRYLRFDGTWRDITEKVFMMNTAK